MKIMVNTIKKTVLLAGGLFLSVLSINADDNPTGLTPEMLLPQFTNLTPEAASLGKYGAFQVSEYSGAANISIPLYTVKSGDVSFPINLYYDATGIKVEQDATFVGLGWNLSYGGMISHIVCGEDDFLETEAWWRADPDWITDWWKEKMSSVKSSMPKDLPFLLDHFYETKRNQTAEILKYYKLDSLLYRPDSLLSEIFMQEEDYKEVELYDKMAKGYNVPDVFQASFCGHNISFAIDKRAGKIPNSDFYPIKILNNNSRKYKISYKSDSKKVPWDFYGYPTSFAITDDKGITYCFNKAYCENPWPNVPRGNAYYDSYYLTKIYGPDGENGKSVVRFKYNIDEENGRLLFSFGPGSRPSTKSHKPTAKRIYNETDYCPNNKSNEYNSLILPSSYEAEIASGESGRCDKVYPVSISTSLETIVFNTVSRLDIPGAKISEIVVKSNIGSATREIKFNYEYFSETPAQKWHEGYYSHKRLKLTGVTIDDQNYKFEYDSQNLPSFASYSKDYWGYYNGANPDADKFVGCSPAYAISNGKVVPVEHYLEGSNRLASEKLCKVGMLKKITYPTGGYTLYEFEANRFNDKYYYPDASHKISFPPAIERYCGKSLSVVGNMTNTMQITPTQENVELVIKYKFNDIYDNLDVTVTNNNTKKNVWSHYYRYLGDKKGEDTISLSQTKDVTYTIEMKLHAAGSSGINTYADCQYFYYVKNTNITASLTTANENGGYSIGGGVRVKTIKNYDSDGTYLNGVKYEYTGGKLLSPTVQLETHYVDVHEVSMPNTIRFSFLYANTEPSYSYICSLGIPATVGYDKVVKKEINESENVTYRKTVLDFHNYGYVSDDCNTNLMNLRMQNPFYINSLYGNQGHLNGMIKTDSVFAGSELASTTQYDYGSMPIDTIYYQKCLPLHLPGEKLGVDYNQLFFRKCNTWSYLTSKTETQYDKNGKPLTSNTTSFQYNPTNYQLSDLSVTDGTNTSRTLYSYPASNTLRFKKHILSEVDGVKTYKNGKLTGGSKFTYKVHKNPQTGASFSVVETCRSLLPNGGSVTEMTVTSYDDYGNIREYKKKDEPPVTVIWSYNHQLPIMEIVGSTYTEVCNKAKNVKDISSLENASSVSETTMSSIHATLRENLPNALVTAYTYSPWHSVSEIIKPNGDKVKYNYDQYGRLEKTSDINGKTLQKFTYNYKKEK